VQELATLTGTMDRWSEAVIENSYGRVSLLSQPVVLPILYMPRDVASGLNSFTYSESLVQQHLQSLGYDMYRDFHTLLVSLGSTLKTYSCAHSLQADARHVLPEPPGKTCDGGQQRVHAGPHRLLTV
jgi:hypothetical protein